QVIALRQIYGNQPCHHCLHPEAIDPAVLAPRRSRRLTKFLGSPEGRERLALFWALCLACRRSEAQEDRRKHEEDHPDSRGIASEVNDGDYEECDAREGVTQGFPRHHPTIRAPLGASPISSRHERRPEGRDSERRDVWDTVRVRVMRPD